MFYLFQEKIRSNSYISKLLTHQDQTGVIIHSKKMRVKLTDVRNILLILVMEKVLLHL